ncbi:hypothetical protein ASE46_03705 [Bacillus sp. Root239]|jgi:hypothetical protein|nr:hypothetical protein ASE46_03705 [Bacillus sp. Root239]
MYASRAHLRLPQRFLHVSSKGDTHHQQKLSDKHLILYENRFLQKKKLMHTHQLFKNIILQCELGFQ